MIHPILLVAAEDHRADLARFLVKLEVPAEFLQGGVITDTCHQVCLTLTSRCKHNMRKWELGLMTPPLARLERSHYDAMIKNFIL